MNKSFVMLKPECIQQELTEAVIDQIIQHGFTIETKEDMIVDEELILKHYEEVIARLGDEFKDEVIEHFVGKRVIKMIVSKPNGDCIKEFRVLVGATQPIEADKDSIRGMFSHDSYELANFEHRVLLNLIHASDSEDSAKRELDLWFK